MLQMNCKLCVQPETLVDSHIIPRGIHKKLKSKNGKYGGYAFLPNKIKTNHQSDLKEYLLCADCEKILNRIETPSLKFLSNQEENFTQIIITPQQANYLLPFVFSVFWRASVSGVCAAYNLPYDIENNIRLALYNENPSQLPNFQLNIRSANIKKGLIISPWRLLWEGAFPPSSYFFANGLIFSFHEVLGSSSASSTDCLNLQTGGLITKALFHEEDMIDSCIKALNK